MNLAGGESRVHQERLKRIRKTPIAPIHLDQISIAPRPTKMMKFPVAPHSAEQLPEPSIPDGRVVEDVHRFEHQSTRRLMTAWARLIDGVLIKLAWRIHGEYPCCIGRRDLFLQRTDFRTKSERVGGKAAWTRRSQAAQCVRLFIPC